MPIISTIQLAATNGCSFSAFIRSIAPGGSSVLRLSASLMLLVYAEVDARSRGSASNGGDRLRPTRPPLPIPEPAGTPRRDDEIDVPAAALRATEPARPLRHREIGTVPLGLLAGVEIDPVPAILAPDAQQQVRLGRGAERRRTGVAFRASPFILAV